MKRLVRLSAAALVSAAVTVNALAFMQARGMTRFIERGARTAAPEQLAFFDRLSVVLSSVSIPRPVNKRTPGDLNLAFISHRFPNPQGETLEAWFVPSKRDRLVVALFHGYAASKSTLLTTAAAFHQLGYATLLVDFYGSGGSSGSGTTIGIRESADVSAAAEYIRRTWPEWKIVLYGMSMGGAAVLRAVAEDRVEADGVIIEATFDSLLNTGKNRFRAMGLPASPFAELLLFWGSVQNGFNAFAHNPVDYARRVKHPALILHGEKDERTKVQEARSIAVAMGANARFVAYDGVPHMPIVDVRFDDWSREVATFLKEIH